MRILLDECVRPWIGRRLIGLGHDVSSAADDPRLKSHSDDDLFAFAVREGRVLVSLDAGFEKSGSYPYHRSPGIVLIRPDKTNKSTVYGPWLFQLLETVPAEAFRSALLEVSEDGVTRQSGTPWTPKFETLITRPTGGTGGGTLP